MAKTILCNLSDANEVINEEKEVWVLEVLLKLGIAEETLDFQDIRDFRYEMDKAGVEVELMASGEVNIYKKAWHEGVDEYSSGWLPVTKNHLVAQWKQPTKTKKVEGKDVYYEIQLNCWAMV